MKNPFQFGRELGKESLVDRKDELTAVEQTIVEGNKLFLIGPRRYGKTSILKVATDRLSAKSGVVLRLDAESYPSIDFLVEGLVAATAKSLKGGVKRAGEQARRFFAALRPELDYSLSSDTWSVKLGVGADRREKSVLLVDALNGFEEMARALPDSRPVGLIIDEFQRIIEIGGRVVEGQIRSAIQTHSRVGYVFAGSKTRMLNDMVTDSTRPFYRLGSQLFLGPVPRVDFVAFLRKGFREGGFSLEPGAVEHLLDLAEDVPYNVQWLAHNCWSQLRDNRPTEVSILTSAFVDETLTYVVRQQDPFYTQLWTGLTAIQQKTLMAVVQQRGVNLQSNRTSQLVAKSAGTIRKSLLSMIDTGILREEQSIKATRIRFEDPFFGRWIQLTTNPDGWQIE